MLQRVRQEATGDRVRVGRQIGCQPLRDDMAAADATGAQIGTPAFFINGRFFAGALPFDEFRRRIDQALAARR